MPCVQESGTFVIENAKGAHGEVYRFHTSVISAHFFDQDLVFFFFAYYILIKVSRETNCLF